MKALYSLLISSAVLLSNYNVHAEHIKMIVREEQTTCYTTQETTCYWVKLKNYKDWSSLAAPIENFDYEEGYRYELIVDRQKPENNSTNIDDFKYTLVKIASKELVASPPSIYFDSIKNSKLYITYFLDQDISDQVLHLYLNTDNNKITINGPCNTLMGTYTANGSMLNIGPIASTRKACPNQSELENQLASSFNNSHLKYKKAEDYILVYKNDKHIMTLSKNYSNQEFKYLASKNWKLYKYDTTLMTHKLVKSYLKFDDKNQTISGFDGCNTFNGKVEVLKNKIEFNQIVSTMKGCVDAVVNDISNNYARIFNTKNLTYEIKDDRLYIKSGENILMIFDSKN
jgi:heat shock protein HslJ